MYDFVTVARSLLIHEPQTGAKTCLRERGKEGLHFDAGQDHREDVRLGNAHLVKNGPGGEFKALAIEAAQSELRRFHGAMLVMFVLAQEQEVLPQLVLGQCGRIALEMLGEFAEIADILLFGGLSIIFEIDVLLELSDRRLGIFHAPGRCPRERASERQNHPA